MDDKHLVIIAVVTMFGGALVAAYLGVEKGIIDKCLDLCVPGLLGVAVGKAWGKIKDEPK